MGKREGVDMSALPLPEKVAALLRRPLSFRSIRGWAREVRRTHPQLSLHECVMEGYAKACDEELGYANEKWREYD